MPRADPVSAETADDGPVPHLELAVLDGDEIALGGVAGQTANVQDFSQNIIRMVDGN